MADSAFASLETMLRSYDLAELLPGAREQWVNGSSVDQVMLWLRSQEPFRRKYAPIFEREKQGLPPVTVNEVVEYRRRAREIEQMYDMPADFVDTDRLMVSDVSLQELATRAQQASAYVDQRTDITGELGRLYGLGRGAAIAYVLDPDTALPAVQRRYMAAQVSAQAGRQGFGALNVTEAEQLAGLGVTEADAASGFGTLAQAGELTKTLEGEQPGAFTRDDQLALVAGSAVARRKLGNIQDQRRAVFQEGGGFAQDQRGMRGLGIADA